MLVSDQSIYTVSAPNFKRFGGGPWKSSDDLTWNEPMVINRIYNKEYCVTSRSSGENTRQNKRGLDSEPPDQAHATPGRPGQK